MSRFRRIGPGIRSEPFASFCASFYGTGLWGVEQSIAQRIKLEKKGTSLFPKRSMKNLRFFDDGSTGIFSAFKAKTKRFCKATFTVFEWNRHQDDERLDVCTYFWLRKRIKYRSWRVISYTEVNQIFEMYRWGSTKDLEKKKRVFLRWMKYCMSSLTSEWITWRTLWGDNTIRIPRQRNAEAVHLSFTQVSMKARRFSAFFTTDVIRALCEYIFFNA